MAATLEAEGCVIDVGAGTGYYLAAVVVLNIFAPRNGAELRRVINPACRLLDVTPTRDHLGELVQPLELLTIDERKDERLAEKLTPCRHLADVAYSELRLGPARAVQSCSTPTPPHR